MAEIPVYALRARYVFPVTQPPIAGGVVTIAGGRITSIGTSADCPIHDLGDAALLPGLVNAHTHLEFSDLAYPLGTRGMSLPEWIPLVLAHRRGADGDSLAAISRGLAECKAAGTAALGEIATTDWRPPSVSVPAHMGITMFHESIAPTRERVPPVVAEAERFVNAPLTSAEMAIGLSPHAPYTVCRKLFNDLVQLAARRLFPVAMHLAESHEELELLHTGGGPFQDLLESAGVWDESDDARYDSIELYLWGLTLAPRALVIHGNYLTDDEIELIADRRDSMSIVYCPRTHAWFGHEPYPLARYLMRGVNMALGTDSRASNADLDLFGEMQHVADHHPSVAPAKILELATLGGARALGLASQLGSLEIGKLARFRTVPLPAHEAADPHELLLQ